MVCLSLQVANNNLEAKLRKQQFESEVDSKWLQQEENNLVGYTIQRQFKNDEYI